MSDHPQAVFLSYAHEDTDAARRIAEALRSQGVEVWFDQSELRGGDTWDAKIRKQIKECALFLPVISAKTQERREGYFRLEWKLAVERTHLMAEGTTFLAPIVVDPTTEGGAMVPAEFKQVQWIRLPGALPTPEFIAQVKRLLAAPTVRAGAEGSASRRTLPAKSHQGRGRLVLATALLVAAAAGVLLWKFLPGRSAGPARPPVIVLMDSTYPNRVYDPATLKSGGSNADDITNLLRDLPVTMIKEGTSSVWNREAEVVKEHPTLIVIHRSCFFTFPDSQGAELYPLADNKLVAFMGYVATLSPETKFIIYSRHSWEDPGAAAKWCEGAANRFPVLAGKLETWRVPLDRATFRDPLTGQELRTSVERALGFKAGPAVQN